MYIYVYMILLYDNFICMYDYFMAKAQKYYPLGFNFKKKSE